MDERGEGCGIGQLQRKFMLAKERKLKFSNFVEKIKKGCAGNIVRMSGV